MEPTAPTQKFIEIKEIRDGVVCLKNGKLRKILIVSGVNFDLKSEEEQTLILNSFQNFLNGLDFSTQFFIHSRKVNIERYLELITARKAEEPNKLLKVQIEEYAEFIKSFVEQNAIITKTFFAVVPFDPIIIPGQTAGLLSMFKKSKPTTGQPPKEELSDQKNLQQLNQRVDQVVNGLTEIGLRAVPLDDKALTELFYNLYNPRLVEKRGLEISK
jgi:type IV secretory pathway VirB4 component